MTEYSVCTQMYLPAEYSRVVVCGDFKADPVEAMDSYRKEVNERLANGLIYNCGENAVRWRAKRTGDGFFGSGLTPEAAKDDIIRAYRAVSDPNIFTALMNSLRMYAYIKPRFCSLPEEAAKDFYLKGPCTDDPCSENPCDSNVPCLDEDASRYPAGVAGHDHEVCSDDPCSLNPCDPYVECDDIEFYRQHGMFVPPPGELLKWSLKEAEALRMLNAPPSWEGCHD